MSMPCTMTSRLLVDVASDALLCSAGGKGAGVVAPHNPHPTTSLLRCLLASNRSNDLCGPYGTTRLSLDRSAAPFFSSNSALYPTASMVTAYISLNTTATVVPNTVATAFRSREGRPHSYCLHAEVVGHGQAPCRGGQPWPGYLQGEAAHNGSSPQGAATRGHSRLQPARKGLPPVASPAASRGDIAGRRGDRPLARRLPAAKGSRHLRRGSGSGGVLRVKEG
ncbi:hypothetical protein BHM03_00060573 [Ensete ventricosum]|nr:hypothetical protein BHM03_00060573 [Ensete ventricosum]